MWDNRCKVAVSGVGYSKVSRSADMPLAAGKRDNDDLERQRSDIVPQQAGDGVLIVAGDQRRKRQRYAQYQ